MTSYLSNKKKLLIIKLTHTLVWLVMVAAIAYVCYAGVFNKINGCVWLCVALIVGEGIVLLLSKGYCPLTILARRYTDKQSVGFDIFLPVWLAKHNKFIFSTLFLAGLLLVLWRQCL